MLAIEDITKFLIDHVEGFYADGYVPSWYIGTDHQRSKNYKGVEPPELFEAMYSSGVTIGAGCDMGQTNATYLRDYKTPQRIISQVEYYLGKKKHDALVALHEIPLRMSREDAMTLTHCVHGGYMERFVIPGYDKDSGKSFVDLPTEAQVCIASICYQKGVGGVRRTAKNTWAAFCRCDWKDAYNRLTNHSLWNDFQDRRRTEGQLLRPLF